MVLIVSLMSLITVLISCVPYVHYLAGFIESHGHNTEKIYQDCLEGGVPQAEDRIVHSFTSGVTERVTEGVTEKVTAKEQKDYRSPYQIHKGKRRNYKSQRNQKWSLANKWRIVKVACRCQDSPKSHNKSIFPTLNKSLRNCFQNGLDIIP